MTAGKLDQITEDLKSMQFDDEEASKYFINYISDDTDRFNDNNNHLCHDNDVRSLPNSLLVTPVPHDLFTDQQMRDEFEQLFRIYDPHIIVLYLKFFQRVRITFTSSQNALQARLHYHRYSFHGTIINTYFAGPMAESHENPDKYLRPPEPDKLYLISPPCSPPSEWEQRIEAPPLVDLNLLAAIAQLQPNESHQLLPRDHNTQTPSIVIDTCEDSNDVEINESLRKKLIRPKFVQTRRPLHDQANEHI
ncbi:unnamed protein product [Rotaria magnacalcarata]|uniref:Uncharacterized protein n=3 Tax=Rotaria magnacalcarata TaxID=392030 RepID=A0A816BNX9_9BILA|nr:unnamed protein product [Rotaria magnacalcarata]CAF2149540.1 unnamed protein product [Rotaria magnacalcarata]CAF2153188.1 unnamed protein product [Rotaria magnacalcarata]CAF2169838.1 unnamed protein product [Rotaria magnacalcarata]CAF3796779.1 unnamed protein product [Rotaria magnacalcarata]